MRSGARQPSTHSAVPGSLDSRLECTMCRVILVILVIGVYRAFTIGTCIRVIEFVDL